MAQVTQTRTGSRNKVEFGTIGPMPPDSSPPDGEPNKDGGNGVFADIPL